METKEIELECPCCRARLQVDVRTSQVMRWRPAAGEEDAAGEGERAPDWETAHERATGRLGRALDKFEEGAERERTRERDLDDLFRRANDKLKGKDPEGA